MEIVRACQAKDKQKEKKIEFNPVDIHSFFPCLRQNEICEQLGSAVCCCWPHVDVDVEIGGGNDNAITICDTRRFIKRVNLRKTWCYILFIFSINRNAENG